MSRHFASWLLTALGFFLMGLSAAFDDLAWSILVVTGVAVAVVSLKLDCRSNGGAR